MTKEKFKEIGVQELENMCRKADELDKTRVDGILPLESWILYKNEMTQYMGRVDELYEVYEMENKGSK